MFIVIEIQSGDKTSTLVNAYENKADAENKYHTILAYASKSSIPLHSAVMLSAEGFLLKNEFYDRREAVIE